MNTRPDQLIPCFLAISIGTFSSIASAAFVGGVERFDGTSLDAATWSATIPSGSSITQNDQLIITNPARHQTISQTIHVGETVSADVKLLVNSTGASTEAHFALVNPGVDEWSFEYSGGRRSFYLGHYTPPGGGGSIPFSFPVDLSAFTMQMRRATSDTLEITAFSGGSQLFTHTHSTGPMAADLRIALALRGSGQIAFDNITVVPEPPGALLVAIACGGVASRRHRQRCA
jgi:hypothetical protein